MGFYSVFTNRRKNWMTENEKSLFFDTLLTFSGPVGFPRLVAEKKWADGKVSSPNTSGKTVMTPFHKK